MPARRWQAKLLNDLAFGQTSKSECSLDFQGHGGFHTDTVPVHLNREIDRKSVV
jgi:hypothetical protein